MPPSEKIRNVGPKSAAWLRQIGIRTEEDLRKFGAVEAYRRVKLAGFKPTLNLLYSMAGAECRKKYAAWFTDGYFPCQRVSGAICTGVFQNAASRV